ncbi:MAG: hypothetical protein ACOX2O_02740 [Bdellovibrionota bacterium]|jgi:hypothetical protein
MLRNDSGIGKLTLLVFGVIIAATLFIANQVVPIWYYHLELANQMEQLARVGSNFSDREIRSKLRTHLRNGDIPATENDLVIRRYGDDVTLSLKYEEGVFIPWRGEEHEVHTFKFHIVTDGSSEEKN